MRFLKTLTTGAALALLCTLTPAADADSPVGLWKVPNENNQDRFLVRVTANGDTLSAKVEKILLGDPNERCTECPSDDARKDKPVLGMTIVQGLKKDGDIYAGGSGLAVASGRIFKAEMKLIDGGRKMELKAKVAFLSKTTTWVRVE